VVIEQATEDAERLDEVWELERDADGERARELHSEEDALLVDIDRLLPPSPESPPLSSHTHLAEKEQGSSSTDPK
jgi:hypothetical protein